MNVVYVSTLERGGPLSHLRDLAPDVAREGVDVRVVCASEEVARGFREAGVEATATPVESKWDLRGAARMWKLLEGADVVHTHDRRAGLFARPQGRLRGARPVHTLHGLPEEIAVRLGRTDAPVPPGVSRARLTWIFRGYLPIERALTALGDVVVPSDAMRRFLVEHGLPERRLHVVPYGIHRREPTRTPSNGTVVVGTAANLEYWKGLDLLIDACSLVRTPFRLEVFGDGTLRPELERQAERAGVDARFHGFVNDYVERLGSLDLFVLPSRGDNLPVSILEAMSAGLPVVGTRVGGIPELIAHGETGLVVEPESPHALAEAIEALVSDRARREELGRKGAERVAAHFDAKDVARRMVRLYEELCASST